MNPTRSWTCCPYLIGFTNRPYNSQSLVSKENRASLHNGKEGMK